MTGLDKEYIKEHSEEVSQLLDSMMEGDQEEIQAKVSAFDQYLEDEELMVHLPDLIAGGGDLSAFAAAIDGYTSDAAAKLQELAA